MVRLEHETTAAFQAHRKLTVPVAVQWMRIPRHKIAYPGCRLKIGYPRPELIRACLPKLSGHTLLFAKLAKFPVLEIQVPPISLEYIYLPDW